ncbi:FAD-linked sulfhydryl oxidase ALR [Ischnura elegans]|uniref:FAD-linked sulfhydryl oxidase ALR n=1 Tax=Ischnura elegans TaxID=197161 RepID=UPI001ED8A5F8|nr:FAD-linked sulfhydryl oxidase ALR [Ischnura elegans]
MATFSGHGEYGGSARQKSCRTCVDFKTWSKQQKDAMNMSPQGRTNGIPNTGKAKDHGCPLDKDELGNATWAVLHTIAAKYPDQPSNKEKEGMKQFVSLFSQFYPCEHCAEDFRKDLEVHPPRITSHRDFSQWLCEMHNRVNKKLGKPIFDCKLVDERWRDGWRDGSCD